MAEIRTECERCEKVRTLIRLAPHPLFEAPYECKTCGQVQEIDTQPEEIT